MNCILCYHEETSISPAGKELLPSKTNYSDPKKRTTNLICSRCTAILLLCKTLELPWDRKIKKKDEFEEMRRKRITKLRRR
jgi:hypothetical protein